jgi:hypothetical protein
VFIPNPCAATDDWVIVVLGTNGVTGSVNPLLDGAFPAREFFSVDWPQYVFMWVFPATGAPAGWELTNAPGIDPQWAVVVVSNTEGINLHSAESHNTSDVAASGTLPIFGDYHMLVLGAVYQGGATMDYPAGWDGLDSYGLATSLSVRWQLLAGGPFLGEDFPLSAVSLWLTGIIAMDQT